MLKFIGSLIKIAFVLFITLIVMAMCGERKPSSTKTYTPNPPEGCHTSWTKESSKHGFSTRAYDGRRLNGERQYLVDWEDRQIWVSHIRIEMNDCIWDLN